MFLVFVYFFQRSLCSFMIFTYTNHTIWPIAIMTRNWIWNRLDSELLSITSFASTCSQNMLPTSLLISLQVPYIRWAYGTGVFTRYTLIYWEMCHSFQSTCSVDLHYVIFHISWCKLHLVCPFIRKLNCKSR